MIRRRSHWGLLALLAPLSFMLACRSSGCSGNSSTSSSKGTAAVGEERVADQSEIGIPKCDEYLSKVGRCIAEHAPEDRKKALELNLKRTNASWAALATNPGTRPSLDQTCDLALTSIKASFQSLSCEW
jgi:hypothetical protein